MQDQFFSLDGADLIYNAYLAYSVNIEALKISRHLCICIKIPQLKAQSVTKMPSFSQKFFLETITLTCLIQGEALIKGEGGQILLKRGGEGGKLTKINKRP